ncbi:uncharacterized protein LOC118172579 isoform X2 [Oxyura jamaicensis]|uniref:uncharacterized protein LOC118172579 isoform X2 n=1 Tax=Oxyura jamaicensis TaxID=8884 RepID=UPI0015A541E1|nr:uncharacterized protein LOC118172579 isoform X2 [Oxyura jamaicensis]
MAAAACPGGAEATPGARFVYENKSLSTPKVYVLQPWIASLLVNYEKGDASGNLLAGQVLRVLSDSSAPDQAGALQDAELQVSDGSYYIRVVITAEALRAEENTHIHLKLSSLICRIIVLQKYTVCFREEARLEDCEFYLTAHQFIVLPMERQKMDSSNGNHEPSVLQKIKELWLRSISLGSAPSSEPSISQLIDVIGQNQLEALKESAEECLDLQVSKETEKDKLPVTQWEAELKKEPREDIFMVPANILVIPPEEGVVDGDASKAGDVCEASPEKSNYDKTVPGDQTVISQPNSAESTALSGSSETSLDNPWNMLPTMSLTLTSSEEQSFQHSSPCRPEAQQDVAADSNTPDLLESCSHDSPQDLLQADPVQTSSPSLLSSYGSISPVKASTTRATSTAEAAYTSPCAARGPLVSGDSQANLPSLSPAFPVLPSSHLVSHTEGVPHREQADSSGTAFPPDMLKHHPAHSRTQGEAPKESRKAAGARRKQLVGSGPALPDGVGHGRRSLSGLQQKQPRRGASWGTGKEVRRKLESVSTEGAKKIRREEHKSQRREESPEEEEEEEEEQATSVSGPSSRPEQRRVLQPVKMKQLGAWLCGRWAAESRHQHRPAELRGAGRTPDTWGTG